MPQNVVIGDTARRRAIRSLRGQILRARKQQIEDKDALAKFAYRTGYPLKIVNELYDILIQSKKIQVMENE